MGHLSCSPRKSRVLEHNTGKFTLMSAFSALHCVYNVITMAPEINVIIFENILVIRFDDYISVCAS